MKYLKEFATHAEYEAYTANTSNFILPNVSICIQENDIHYNPNVKPPTPEHDYVEIGGVKWATMNVGANSITDTGLYFQWADNQGYTADQVGDGEGQKLFDTMYWSDYKYGNPNEGGLTKYNATDGKTVLEASDDAAQAYWGGSWRMPTAEEFQALSAAVTTAWTQVNGVYGMLCTDKTDNTKTLFFPAAGHCGDGSVYSVGSIGHYWSSSLFSNVSLARLLLFGSGYVYWDNHSDRSHGYTVRGVLGSAPVSVTGVTLNKSSLSLEQGASETLVATVLPISAANKRVTWTSSNSSVATVDSNGKVTAVGSGNATITVTTVDGGFTAQCATSVVVPPECVSEIVETTYEMVDLDLPSGVKWATKNVGAESITDYGQKFSWGGISGYTHDQISGECHSKAYSWSDYELGNGGSTVADMTKYNNSDHLSTLELSDDAARVNMGGSWRMPTQPNFSELLDTSNCTKEWVTNYEGSGVNGYLFTSVRNSNTLFFPAAGVCVNGSVYSGGDGGNYWSSTIYEGNRKFAFYLYFNYSGEINWNDSARSCGYTVRGVVG